ncbi:hypothetical protein HDF14_005346 [Edaphobacter lichenicola]|jgi:hypothetical protein|uniref:Uncharacterized protein n=1 Tax=Tunturiibacter gelidiferens TaxID=3069689 RepID=A0A9X0QJN5_9BACT|nr:hypothetical protein [Edaphobacter lichenicola]
MSNAVSPIMEDRIVVTLSRQLCSTLLHNWHLVSDREAGWQ